MAEDTEAHLAMKLPEVMEEPEASASDVVASGEPSQPQDAPTPAARGKRAIDDGFPIEDEDGDEDNELEGKLPPRKKARTGPASGKVAEQDTMNNAGEGNDDLKGDSMPSNSADGKDSTSSHSVSSKDFDRAGWSATHKDAYGDLIAQARASRRPREKSPQQAASSDGVVRSRALFATPAASIPAGLRTSFGAAPPQAQSKPGEIRFEMHNPLTNDEHNQLVAAVRDQGSLTVDGIVRRDLNWTVSPLRVEYLVGNTWLEIWESTVDKWCEAFVADNQANIAEVGLATSLLKNAFDIRLSGGKDLPQIFLQVSEDMLRAVDSSRMRNFGGQFKPDLAKLAKKKAKKEKKEAKEASRQARRFEAKAKAKAAQEAQPASNSFNSINAEERLAGVQAADPVSPVNKVASGGAEETVDVDTENTQGEAEMEDGEINSADASGVDMEIDEDGPPAADTSSVDMETDKDGKALSQAELDQRHRYFPSIPDDAIFCLTCGHIGHSTEKCPELICKFCQGPHFKYECLMRQRCGKCKQLGHTRTSCSEKLAVAPGEAVVECAICEGHDHTEIDCMGLYQIYKPQPDNIKKVKHIPAFCYVCGIEGHYGGDCQMADYSIPPTKMWTIATASLYVDPNSEDVALSLRNPLPPPPDDSRPFIPGRSIKPQTHAVYVEDDDDVDGNDDGPNHSKGGRGGFFEKNKFNKNKPKTAPKINISSNLTFGGNTGPSNPNPQQQAQLSQVQLSKRQKGPDQPPKKKHKPTNEALPGTKPYRPKPSKPQPQPPSNPGQDGGGGGRGRGRGRGDGGGGGGGRGGGGFSALNTNNRARGGRRLRNRGGRGGQN